ncbi:MAG: hypothetical protein HYV13_03155 [Candidatus Doudnabacteria bacterium]|nr:hypothetical protein [Candidatus Doudnabacteria bacterium]
MQIQDFILIALGIAAFLSITLRVARALWTLGSSARGLLGLLGLVVGGFVLIWLVTLMPESVIPVQGKRLLQIAGILMMLGGLYQTMQMRFREAHLPPGSKEDAAR